MSQVFDELDERVIPNHHHDTPCGCGHRHAEHSIFGSCHGCSDCDEDDDLEAEHDHAYVRCDCRDFHVAASADASELALTG